jgi:hypothetical protein
VTDKHEWNPLSGVLSNQICGLMECDPDQSRSQQLHWSLFRHEM